MQAAGVLAPLQLQALRAGRRAFQRGWGRRQRARPGQQRWTQRTGADGVYSLDLDATFQSERKREMVDVNPPASSRKMAHLHIFEIMTVCAKRTQLNLYNARVTAEQFLTELGANIKAPSMVCISYRTVKRNDSI